MVRATATVLRSGRKGASLGTRYPVHKPSISSLEIVESAYKNKNRSDLLTLAQGVDWGKEKISFSLLPVRARQFLNKKKKPKSV